jgi:3-oxoacyl-[acyl-carrier protein] reductase
MDLGLTGRTVFITGASGGIGSAIARQFRDEGAQVAVHYHRRRETGEALARVLGSSNAAAFGGDLTSEREVGEIFRRVRDRFGSVHHLVTCAGVWPPLDTPVCQMTLDQWQNTLHQNLTSAFLCCREFLARQENSSVDDPSIVVIGSTAGVFGEAGHADYASAKAALAQGLVLSLKNEIVKQAPLGRVNAVCPGWTLTPMAESFAGNRQATRGALSTIPLRKFATPEDIAPAVVFLSSPVAAGHITGQMLVISGGMEGRRLFDDSELDLPRPNSENR